MNGHAKRAIIASIGLLFCTYVGSYLVLSRRGYTEADAINAKGFYFVLPMTTEGKRANDFCNCIYWPLVQLEVLLGTGRTPASDPTTGLSTTEHGDARPAYPDSPGSGESRPETVDTYDARGLLISHVDANERETKYEYDGAGRLVSVMQVNPGQPTHSPKTVYEYDDAGNLLKVIDPLENETERVYDGINRLTDVYEPDPDGTGPKERPRTKYSYDAAGRLHSLTDPANNATKWFYDDLGRVKQEKNQIGQSRYFDYDKANRLTSRTDRLGRTVTFDYNELDQVEHEYWYNGQILVRTITHDYDDAGQLTGVSDPGAAYTYLPDRLGRVGTETQAIAGMADPIHYVSNYNQASSRTSLTATIGTTLDFHNIYGYDNLQRLTSLAQQGQSGASVNPVAEKFVNLAYNASGQFKSIGRYADLAGTVLVANTFYDYDPLGRLESMIHTLDTDAPTSGWGTDPLAGYVYTYDDASRIWAISNLIDGLTDYAYDNTNQLTGADHGNQSDEAYSYDANGNRTMSGYSTGMNNQLQSDGTYTYVYDAEGNRVRRTKIADGAYTVYEYDHRTFASWASRTPRWCWRRTFTTRSFMPAGKKSFRRSITATMRSTSWYGGR